MNHQSLRPDEPSLSTVVSKATDKAMQVLNVGAEERKSSQISNCNFYLSSVQKLYYPRQMLTVIPSKIRSQLYLLPK
jgi:hypothetical protein